MEAFQGVKQMEKTQAEKPKDKRKHQWTPPPNGSFKINVDAEAKAVGLGVVIRDDEGRIVTAATKPSRFRCGVSFAEAKAAEWGRDGQWAGPAPK